MAEFDAQPGREPTVPQELTEAQLEADEGDLQAGLRGVAGMVAGALGLAETLSSIAGCALQAIPRVTGVGVSLVAVKDQETSLATCAATAGFVREIDTVQYDELHEGPCLTAMHSLRPAVSGSLGSDQRWPHFGGRVARLGVHSALSLPLVVGDRVIGAINAYAHQRDAFAEHAVRLGSTFAGPAAVSVFNAQLLTEAQERTARLQRALNSRAVIDQAIGIVRSRTGASEEEAFARLIRISQSENVKLHIVAVRLVEEAVRRAQARHRSS
jgi:GAF domain-containing protein